MKQRPHARSTELIASCAKTFNVNVESFDNDKWSAGFAVAKALDTLVDDDHDYRSGEYFDRLINGASMPYLGSEEAEFVRAAYA